ncbi:hypothetical protein [Nocardioides lianchengensis]|nr:hypothetical protein [Nocardioides lianchengensis]NYG08896.1 hypothetical protein [Nocardioides lianchengensis]
MNGPAHLTPADRRIAMLKKLVLVIAVVALGGLVAKKVGGK